MKFFMKSYSLHGSDVIFLGVSGKKMSTDLVRRGDVAFVDEDYETAIQVGISLHASNKPLKQYK